MANIRITNRTRTREVLPLLNADSIERLLDAVPEAELETTVLGMKIRDFAEILTNEEVFIAKLMSEKYALTAFGKLKAYRRQINELSAFVKKYDFKENNEETQAKKGIVFPNMAQRMLSDCVRYFHLKSFDEAEGCTVSDWLTIFQEDAANALYQRRLHEIFQAKSKQKKKK
ncbi:MAG: hypothetical protein IKD78_11560 [Bacteroidales bacterium]|nr:hypothetical protein [Bacteroidales bacterium]